MIRIFSVFQFSFLYIPILFIGMAIYGTDIKSNSGYINISGILIISFILFLFKSRRYPAILLKYNALISVIGGLSALFLYKQLHVNFWDEHSISQAILIMIIGITSCLISINASMQAHKQNFSSVYVFQVISLFSIIWLLSIYYPMIAFFFIGLNLILNPLFSTQNNATTKFYNSQFSRYFIFIIFLDLPLVVWDFQVNTQWGTYLSISFFACAFGFIVPVAQRFLKTMVIVFLINFIFCTIQPDYILNPLHSLISGLTLGVYLNARLHQNTFSYGIIAAIAAPSIVGFIVSLIFYSNLSYATWRSIFIIPLVLFFIIKAVRKPQYN